MPERAQLATQGDGESAVVWRDWTEGLAETAERRLPALVLCEPWWTTAAQRLNDQVSKDERLSRALGENCVPIRIDPIHDPDKAARIRAAMRRLGGSAGPPVLAMADTEGRVFMPFASLAYEGVAGGHPSLAAVIDAVSGAQEFDALRRDAAKADHDSGPSHQDPHAVRPYYLHRLIDAAVPGGREEAEALEKRITLLLTGGVRDHVGGGFHRASRDDRFIVPHFEKPLPLNAELAAVLARAGRLFDRTDWTAVAVETAEWVQQELADDPDVGAVAADSAYHTWTPREFTAAVPAQVRQAAALHFGITRANVAHVLYAAQTADEIAALGYRSTERVTNEIDEAKSALALHRSARPQPERIPVAATEWRCATLAGLARAAEAGLDIDTFDLADRFEALAAERFTGSAGWRRRPDGGTGFAQDQKAATDAAECLARLTGREALKIIAAESSKIFEQARRQPLEAL